MMLVSGMCQCIAKIVLDSEIFLKNLDIKMSNVHDDSIKHMSSCIEKILFHRSTGSNVCKYHLLEVIAHIHKSKRKKLPT